jgi:hypothetical protein
MHRLGIETFGERDDLGLVDRDGAKFRDGTGKVVFKVVVGQSFLQLSITYPHTTGH